MRPILVLLVAKLYGEIKPETLHAAVSLELLHTASLVHDDVVDESTERRGQLSVNAIFNNKVAVLVGDFLLATSLVHAERTRNHDIIGVVFLVRTSEFAFRLKTIYSIILRVRRLENRPEMICWKVSLLYLLYMY